MVMVVSGIERRLPISSWMEGLLPFSLCLALTFIDSHKCSSLPWSCSAPIYFDLFSFRCIRQTYSLTLLCPSFESGSNQGRSIIISACNSIVLQFKTSIVSLCRTCLVFSWQLWLDDYLGEMPCVPTKLFRNWELMMTEPLLHAAKERNIHNQFEKPWREIGRSAVYLPCSIK